MPQIYRRTPMPKCDFNKVAKQLNWNHTSAWVFSCKFAAYFQNTFSWEHLWVTVLVSIHGWVIYDKLKGKLKTEYCISSRLFLLSKIFAIGQRNLTPSYFNMHKITNFEIFIGKLFFSSLCRFIYRFIKHFFIYHSRYTFNFESTCK